MVLLNLERIINGLFSHQDVYKRQGKSIFKNVYEQDLFHRVVMEDREKARSNKPDQIIQTIGSEISKARLLELIAGNHDVYFYSMETEIDTVRQSFTKGGGLSKMCIRDRE